MVSKRFQEHTVDVYGQLFDHGMRQIGHGVQVLGVRQIGGRAGLELDFHFKITSIQIDEGFGGRDQKFHRIDPRGHGSQLREPDLQHGRVRLGNTCNSGLMTRDDKLCACRRRCDVENEAPPR